MGALLVLASAAGKRDIRADFAAKVDAADKTGASGIAGKDGWLFFVPELRYLSAGPFWGDNAAKVSRGPAGKMDPLPAILDYKKQLEAQGVDLLVVPVPAKAAIYPDMILDGVTADPAHRVDQAEGDFVKLLNDSGVHALDLTPAYLQYRIDHPDRPLYSKTDTHWSGAGLDVAADLIAAEIKKESWYSGITPQAFTTSPLQVSAKGDIVDLLKTPAPGPENFNLTKPVTSSGAPVAPDPASPVLLLGDSHTLVYSVGGDLIASNAGLPENLAAKIGFAPDVLGVMGSGATPARVNLYRRKGGVAGKKLIVWVFTARDFTEAAQGWGIVPAPKPPAG
jgi:alginate O-acetyltransferase complex protein AlgJ